MQIEFEQNIIISDFYEGALKMGMRSFLKNFTMLDWMIHFGVFANMVVTLYIVWHVFTR